VTVRFLGPAETELDQAVDWYESQTPSLGDAFLIEVLSAVERMALYPQAWHPLGQGLRRCRLNRFPYGLIYAVEMPTFWFSRLLTCTASRDIGATG